MLKYNINICIYIHNSIGVVIRDPSVQKGVATLSLIKHNRSEMVAVLGPYEALPYYIHTY
jgi:hypothetical protein